MPRKPERQSQPGDSRHAGPPKPLPPAVATAAELPRSLMIAEWAVFAMVCFVVACFQVVLYRHSGSFWRDEATSILLSRLPSFSAMWGQLSNDSFPGLFVTMLRGWNESGLGATEDGLRLFGTLILLGLAASLSVSCFFLTRRPPLLALALVALNGAVFYYGSSIRAYGLGALLIVACFAAFWQVVRQPTKWNVALAFLLALLSAHANYQNCHLILAIGVGAAVACAVCQRWRRGLLVLAVCLLVAISMVVYLPAIKAYGDSAIISHFDIGIGLWADRLADALAEANPFLLAVWIVLSLLALVLLVMEFVRGPRGAGSSAPVPSLDIYALATILIAVAVGFGFSRANAMYPFAWHYIPLITLAGVIIEIGVRLPGYPVWGSLGRMAAVVLVVALSVMPVWKLAHTRRTNVDLMCRILEREASPDDRIILTWFWLAPGFGYHYHGQTPWEIIPSIRLDEKAVMAPGHFQKQCMQNPNVLDPTLAGIKETLASGHRVWLLGGVLTPPPGRPPLKLGPAPDPKYGWNNNAYSQSWLMQVGDFLQTHAGRADEVPVSVDQPVKPTENMPLMVVQGWRP